MKPYCTARHRDILENDIQPIQIPYPAKRLEFQHKRMQMSSFQENQDFELDLVFGLDFMCAQDEHSNV